MRAWSRAARQASDCAATIARADALGQSVARELDGLRRRLQGHRRAPRRMNSARLVLCRYTSDRLSPSREERVDSLGADASRSEEHTSELQSRFGISYAVFCLKKTQASIVHRYDTRVYD